MAISNSRFSYGDCYALMDQALADQKGIRIKFASWGDALHFRLRLHTARRIDRKDNLEVYPGDHAMHGKSAYDPLIMRLKATQDGTTWLRLEKVDAREFEVESLADGDAEPELFQHEPSIPYKPPPPAVEVKPIRPRPEALLRRRV